jgi:hypothetical protein
MLHVLTALILAMTAALGVAIVAGSLLVSHFIVGEKPASTSALTGVAYLFPVIFAAAVLAILRPVRWRWLGFAVLPLVALFSFLGHDAPPPPLPDLGPRVGADDPGYRSIMWFSEKSPFSRLGQAGAPTSDTENLWLPEDTVTWSEHVAQNREAILFTWEQNTLGREWIAALDEHPPAGIWPNGREDPILAFRPVRSTALVHLVRAYALALEGRRDESIVSTLPLIRAMYALQRNGASLVHGMIATIVIKQGYREIEATLRLGSVSIETQATLRATLQNAPSMRQVFRNAMLGECNFMHDVLKSLTVDRALPVQMTGNRRDRIAAFLMKIAGRYLFNPNTTEARIIDWCEQIIALAESRDLVRLENWLPDWTTSSQLKNPVGRIMSQMMFPAFNKAIRSQWKTEDARLALLQQLGEASTNQR